MTFRPLAVPALWQWTLLTAIGILAGCGAPQPVTGGTRGLLHARNGTVADIEVTVYRADAAEIFGVGVSGADGWFELRNRTASAAIRLAPGDYAVTLRSVGPDPVPIPRKFAARETTPLVIEWSAESDVLDLELPGPL